MTEKQFCPQCGKEIKAGEVFCGECGTAITPKVDKNAQDNSKSNLGTRRMPKITEYCSNPFAEIITFVVIAGLIGFAVFIGIIGKLYPAFESSANNSLQQIYDAISSSSFISSICFATLSGILIGLVIKNMTRFNKLERMIAETQKLITSLEDKE